MIPKVIHYCWFGKGIKNEKIIRCIDSWKKYCPDYEIIEWNETNYDVSKNSFMYQAYQEKKWAFVSDYARIDIINQHGGIYLDTDVELIKSLNGFLNYKFFAGFENEKYVSFGVGFGSECNNTILTEILQYYESIVFPNSEFGLTLISCPRIQTDILKRHGLNCNNTNQIIDGCNIFNTEYFCPMSFRTGKTILTENTVSIHHFNMSWLDNTSKNIKYFEYKLQRALGNKLGRIIARMITFPVKLMQRTKDGSLRSYLRFLICRKRV